MAETNQTPLWLDLKKEYIDDNFNKLQAYLREYAEKGKKDTFYTTTIELFHELAVFSVTVRDTPRHHITQAKNMVNLCDGVLGL